MSDLVWLLVAASFCLLAGAAFLIADGNRRLRMQGSDRRLNDVLLRHERGGQFEGPFDERAWLPQFFERYLQRSGFQDKRLLSLFLPGTAFVFFILSEVLLGLWAAVLCLIVVYPLLFLGYLNWRTVLFRQRVIGQLPHFLETISSILSVGCSLELAFRNAGEECEAPLYAIVQQVLLRTRAGQALEDAMMQVSDIYGIRELGFVASVFHLGLRYGGNAHAVLERLSVTMRERQRSQQELKAMTGETRASALILSALPVVVGLLTLISNPAYLLGMWQDTTGRDLLLAALLLQILGMFLLVRMSRIS